MTKAICPLCRKPTDPANAPFCSRGCRDRDMLQWLGKGYRIPGRPADPPHPFGDRLDSGGDAD